MNFSKGENFDKSINEYFEPNIPSEAIDQPSLLLSSFKHQRNNTEFHILENKNNNNNNTQKISQNNSENIEEIEQNQNNIYPYQNKYSSPNVLMINNSIDGKDFFYSQKNQEFELVKIRKRKESTLLVTLNKTSKEEQRTSSPITKDISVKSIKIKRFVNINQLLETKVKIKSIFLPIKILIKNRKILLNN